MKVGLRVMTRADIGAGMRLKVQNGWNQLEGDWVRQLELEPSGCFVAERDGKVVGTACGTVFDTVAWVAMVLVDKEQRGQGIGTALMERVLDYLTERQVTSIRLDATPLGQPVYEKLGFQAEFMLHRYEGILPGVEATARKVEAVRMEDVAAIVELDRRITGTNRGRLLERLFQERPEELRLVRGTKGIEGFVGARPGARAWQVGPCLGHAEACRELLLEVWQRHVRKPVFLDIPDSQAVAQGIAKDMGLTVQRPLLRMGRGVTIKENLDEFWTSFGPEKG
jgi:GNAT superfamily N-acetyltransferase